MPQATLLSIKNLTMSYRTRKGYVSAVDDVSFDLGWGEAMGLVGESGCGKTSIAMTLMRLLPDNAEVQGGEILLDGRDILQMSDQEIRQVRWAQISMVFQAAMNALDPVYRVGGQIIEAINHHEHGVQPAQARERVEKLFDLVGIDSNMIDCYPHEYSGGMRQRAVIAMALVCSPSLIIADEPTTALDVIVQDQVLRELCNVQKSLNMSMIYISHDIAVIAEVAEKIAVMYAGRMVEFGQSEAIIKQPVHPYTIALMSAFPSVVGPKMKLVALGGEPPDLLFPPPGCRFNPRCPRATEQCSQEQPPLKAIDYGRLAACWNLEVPSWPTTR